MFFRKPGSEDGQRAGIDGGRRGTSLRAERIRAQEYWQLELYFLLQTFRLDYELEEEKLYN